MTIKNRKKQIAIGALVAVTAIAVPVATVVSCGSKKSEAKAKGSTGTTGTGTTGTGTTGSNVRKELTASQLQAFKTTIGNNDDDSNPIVDKKEVKLVSLGDSVASGFTLLEGMKDEHRGHYDASTKKVSGISYGSYLARAFQKHNKLGDFDNFAIAGATTATLRNQIDPSFKLVTKDEKATFQRTALLKTKEASRFAKLNTKLKNANLITLSIGANDILGKIKLGGLTMMQLISDPSKLSLAGGIDKLIDFGDKAEFDKAARIAEQNLTATIAKIKEINKDAKIVLVGYPMPVAQLSAILKMAKMPDKKTSVSDAILETVSKISTNISKKFKTIDYVDGYTTKEWDSNALDLAPKLFDIHPGPRGQRVVAATILANLKQDKVGQEPFVSNIDNAGDITTRLSEDYTAELTDYMNLKAKLLPEAAAIQAKAQPWKIVKFTANIIGDVLNAMLGSADQPMATQDPTSVYADKQDAMAVVLGLQPFILTLIKGSNAGLMSKDKDVQAGTMQDTKYILAQLMDKASAKVPALGGSKALSALGMVLPQLLPEVGKWLQANATSPFTTQVFQGWLSSALDPKITTDAVKAGPSKLNYVK